MPDDENDWRDNPDAALLASQTLRMQRGFDAAESSGRSATAGYEWEASVAGSLQALRKRIGYSQAEVVELLRAWGVEMHQTTLAKLEAGKRPLRLAELFALAAVYRVSPGTVLLDADTVVDGTQAVDERLSQLEADSQSLRHEFVDYAEKVFDLVRLQSDSRAALERVLTAWAVSKRKPLDGVDQATS